MSDPYDQLVREAFEKEPTVSNDDIREAVRKAKEPRIFSRHMKDECWKNATLMIGRHPDRWRLDAVGNPVMRALTSCMGPMCHEYDHIVPFSKGGKTTVSNCQILQTAVNRYKSNKVDQSFNELKNISNPNKFTNSEFDTIERAVYGDIQKVDAAKQVEEASKNSLSIIYAAKEQNNSNKQQQQS